jgi:hypothetical protein
MNTDERFDRLYAAVIREQRGAEFASDLGNPRTKGVARRIWRRLPDVDGRLKLDRLVLEVKYGDEIPWSAKPIEKPSVEELSVPAGGP